MGEGIPIVPPRERRLLIALEGGRVDAWGVRERVSFVLEEQSSAKDGVKEDKNDIPYLASKYGVS
jgi:hypothetical protein